MNFIDLHVHTRFTEGNSTTDIVDLVDRASSYGMPAIAITDSASIAGYLPFTEACLEKGIKPIYGCGFYLTTGSRYEHSDEVFHIVLLAEDDYGFANILRLNALSHEEGFYNKPRIDFEILRGHSRGIICLTGGLGGVIDKHLADGPRRTATEWVKKLRSCFNNDHFYVEIQRNGHEASNTVYKKYKSMQEKHELTFLATGGSFYLDKDDSNRCNRLRRRHKNNTLTGNGYYFRSPEEMAELYSDIPEAIEISSKIAERCNVSYDFTGLKHKTKDPRERIYDMMIHFGVEALVH